MTQNDTNVFSSVSGARYLKEMHAMAGTIRQASKEGTNHTIKQSLGATDRAVGPGL